MKVKDLFDLKYGVNLELMRCEETTAPDGINFVARTSQNNGVVARVKLIDGVEPQKAGTLSCATSGSVLSTFVQLEPYYSGRDLYVLTPKIELSFEQKLFYAMVINQNAYRYSYGRAANKTLPEIDLPSLEECNKVIGAYKVEKVNSKINKQILDTNTTQWEEFLVNDLFKVTGTKTTKIEDLQNYGKGKYPYVTTQAGNNGIEGFYNFSTEKGNVLTIDSAVLGSCAYQEEDFSASDHVEKLTPKFNMTKYIALFFVTLFNQECYRYSYGRKSNQIKIRNTILKLPVDKDKKPDWLYMENYIKSLPYADLV
ncbi:MAG: restriction endonuclease subunit S [Firmicutes bacterium]|nr:restriction endonuclease subunit S [Bacillota bacterium]